ncbi:cyclin-L1 [Neoconidiobolus thromboides FSU 785]|nr:cyclin-L1 [Neoconidiobolus thromboides FSU 785]
MTRLTLQNPLVTMSQIKSTPSSRDGISETLECELRTLACTFIQGVGINVKTSQKTIATACVLLQRFYFVKSIKEYPIMDIVMGSLFLAGKLEETPISFNKIIMSFDYIVKLTRELKNYLETPHGIEGLEMKDCLLEGEMVLLRELGFNVRVQQPYVLMINYMQLLALHDNIDLVQKAWNYLNDSLKTIVYVSYDPSTIACAAIELACRESDIALPGNPLWYEVFEARKQDVEIVMGYMKRIYTRWIYSLFVYITI